MADYSITGSGVGQTPSQLDPLSTKNPRNPLLHDPSPTLSFLSNLLEGGGGDPALLNAINTIRGGLEARQTRNLSDASSIGYYSQYGQIGQDPSQAGQQKVIRGRSGFGKLFETLGVVGPNTEESQMTPEEQYAAQTGADLAQKRASKQLMDMFKLQHMLNQDTRADKAEQDRNIRWATSLDEANKRFQEHMGLLEREESDRNKRWEMTESRRTTEDTQRMNEFMYNQSQLTNRFNQSMGLKEKEYTLRVQQDIDRSLTASNKLNQHVDEAHRREVSGFIKQTLIPGYSSEIKELQKTRTNMGQDTDEAKKVDKRIIDLQKRRADAIKTMGSFFGLNLDENYVNALVGKDDDPSSDPTPTSGGVPPAPPIEFFGGGKEAPQQGFGVPTLPRPMQTPDPEDIISPKVPSPIPSRRY